jgi:hypothetical protein
MSIRLFVAASLVTASALDVRADDKRAADVAKQKEATTANLRTAGGDKSTFVETDDLIVHTTAAEAKTKATAVSLQKTYTTAAKALQLGLESPWPGKLTVIALADRKLFAGFIRDVEKRRLDNADATSIQISGSTPTVVQGVALGDKPTDTQLTADAAATVATALLMSRVASMSETADNPLPQWLRVGFGKAAANRAQGPMNVGAVRTKARGLLTKGKAGPFKVADLWAETTPKDADTLGAGVVDYMAFGPDAAKFPAFVQGFRPTDENPNPTAETALTAAGWKADALDASWKKWLVTGK